MAGVRSGRKARLRLIMVMLLTAAALSAVARGPVISASAQTAGAKGTSSGKIVFASDRDGNREIYVMNADGSGPTRVTNNPATDGTPDWSPDGTKIAFESSRDGNFEIYVMNADGSGQTRLTTDPANDSAPAWSPDGKQIVFMRGTSPANEDVWKMNADGSGPVRLTTAGGRFPDWSPDGTKIAFDTAREGNPQVYVMNADGSGQTNISHGTSTDGLAEWSPDGMRLAFISDRDGNREIYVMAADGSGQTRLTNNTAFDEFPTWSPNGSQIAFYSQRDGNSEIYVMSDDGSAQTRLTNNSSIDERPDWGPAGAPPSSSTSTSSSTISTSSSTSTSTTSTSTTSTTLAPVVDRYGITSYDRMTGGAPHNGYFVTAFQAFTAQSNRITYLGVTVGTPGYVPDGHTVHVRLCLDSNCSQVLSDANAPIVNYGNSFVDIGDVAVTPGQQYYVVYDQPAPWNGQGWVTYWWAGGNFITNSDQMQAIVKGFNSSTPTRPPPTPPPANGFTVDTSHLRGLSCSPSCDIPLRSGPSLSSTGVGPNASNGATYPGDCQSVGESIRDSDGRSSDVWTRLTVSGVQGFVSNTWLGLVPKALGDCPGTQPPPAAAPRDCEAFAGETIRDGTSINRGTTFTKTWYLTNCGNTDWSGLTAVRIGGSFGPTSFGVPVTSVKATATISVQFTAPNTLGRTRATYTMVGPRGRVPDLTGGPGSFWVDITVVRSGGTPPPPPVGPPSLTLPRHYVALGDSFSSGYGVPPFDSGTTIKSGRQKNLCYRSFYAYGRQVARALKIGTLEKACASAVVSDFYGSQYFGQDRQLNYVRRDTDLVTLTVGGNDVGFRGLVEGCLVVVNCLAQDQDFQYKLMILRQRLPQLYRDIIAASNNARVIVLGYPQVAPDPSVVNTANCSDIRKLGVSLGDEELRFLRHKTAEINQTIAAAVGDVRGVTFIDPSQTFSGHELCTSSPWFNPLSSPDSVGPIHPNLCGQTAYAYDASVAILGDPLKTPIVTCGFPTF